MSYFTQKKLVRLFFFLLLFQSTAVGECQVAYAIRRRANAGVLELTKVINYNKCQHRAEFKQVNYLGEACQECQQVSGKKRTFPYCYTGRVIFEHWKPFLERVSDNTQVNTTDP